MMSDKEKMRRVRIAEVLIEQIEWYDIFPTGMRRTIQARVNYCVSVGLGILMLMFEKEAKERQESGKGFKDGKPSQDLVCGLAIWQG